jgi:hypothetical protein
MTDADNTALVRILQNVQAAVARLELKIADMDDKLDRAITEQYIHRGQIGEWRHNATVIGNRYRDLEVRVQALEDAIVNLISTGTPK